MPKKVVEGHCKLCGLYSRLHESHILPAFVFRSLRKSSGANGHIRKSDNPNQRVQDGLKLHWLCGQCESLFSKEETAFANNIFYPFRAGKVPVRYGPYLLRFCASVSWRVLTFAFGHRKDAPYSDKQRELALMAEQHWRAFLLGQRPHPGPFEQHLLGWSMISNTTITGLPSNINRFLTGPITLDIVGSESSLMTFAKLGPMMVFGHIQVERRTWVGSRVAVKDGTFPSKKYVLPPGLLALFREKAGLVEEGWSKLSDQQRDVIDRNITSKGAEFFDSDQGRAILADAEMFGVESVTSKRN